MRKNIISDGKNLTINTDGVTQSLTEGTYTTHTPLTHAQHSLNGIRESGTSRNVEINGNSQENYAGSGLTTEYRIKNVGSPELFSGEAQKTADEALSSLVGLILQTGDDRNSAKSDSLAMPDFKKVVSSMTSQFQNTMTPDLPQISRLSDIPMYFAKTMAWFSGLSMANAAEAGARAGALEAERQVEQTKIAIEQKKKELGDTFTLSKPESPSTEDKENVKWNITRNDVYDAYVKEIDKILAAQKNIC